MTEKELKKILNKFGQKYVDKIRKDPQGLAGIYFDYLCETANWPQDIKIAMWNNIKECALFDSTGK